MCQTRGSILGQLVHEATLLCSCHRVSLGRSIDVISFFTQDFKFLHMYSKAYNPWGKLLWLQEVLSGHKV